MIALTDALFIATQTKRCAPSKRTTSPTAFHLDFAVPLADDDEEVGELHATPAPLLGTSDVTQLLKLVESPLG